MTGDGGMLADELKVESGCQVNNCDFMAMIDRKDQKITEMAEEIGRLKQEVFTLKKGGQITSYNLAAEP